MNGSAHIFRNTFRVKIPTSFLETIVSCLNVVHLVFSGGLVFDQDLLAHLVVALVGKILTKYFFLNISELEESSAAT